MIKKSRTTQTSGAKPSIVFFGSGPVAAASLELLLENFDIEAVVTKPRPVHHKGSLPVTNLVDKHSLKAIYVSNKQDVSRAITATNFNSRAGVLIDFGIIVSVDVIESFPLGIINSHFSLLPELRGADPIAFAILSGQKRTGVSLMLLVEAMDEGPILGLGVEDNIDTLTTPMLTKRLINLSNSLLNSLLPAYLNSNQPILLPQLEIHKTIPEHPDKPTYTRKLTKNDGLLNFEKPAIQLEREIRAFIEWPKSRTEIEGKDIIITQARVAGVDSPMPGKITFLPEEKRLIIHTSKDGLEILKLKPAGKSEMTIKAFLAGHKIQ